MPLNESEYIEKRLNHQIKWYDRKSMTSQKWYNINKIIQIVCAALIPAIVPFSLISESIIFTIISSLLGILIVITQSINNLKKFHENYIHYRTTCESLRHEKYLYLLNVQPYNDENEPLKLLVVRTESIISSENINWHTMQKDAQEEKKC